MLHSSTIGNPRCARISRCRRCSGRRALAAALTADPVRAVASGAVLNFVGDIEQRTRHVNRLLTDIMLAQDFHDLTGQVVSKVVTLATELEDALIKILRSSCKRLLP